MGMDKLKLYMGAILISKDNRVVHGANVGAFLNKNEAVGSFLEECKKHYPSKEGWTYLSVEVIEVAAELLEQVR